MSAPTEFELWLVQRTGVSVDRQRAMTADEWLARFGEIVVPTADGLRTIAEIMRDAK